MPTVRFIDLLFTAANPSTNGLVRIIPFLIDAGWEVEIWANQIEPSFRGRVSHRKIPLRKSWFGVGPWLSFIDIHLRALGDFIIQRKSPDVTVSTGFYYLPADIATVHFSHVDWLKALFRKGFSTTEGWLSLLASLSGLVIEAVFLWNPWQVMLLTVSDSVADDMRKYAAPWKSVHILPNLAHSGFNDQFRVAARPEARRSHGLDDDETVFAFASVGHYYRKGFKEAVATVDGLRECGHRVRLLVIGGYPKSLARETRWIAAQYPDFSRWITFIGMVSDVGFHLSAADALLFPSASEAFSLVSIEAAALGLPLYLTRHHGSEMTLGAGVPGKYLPWDVPGMVEILKREIATRNVQPGPSHSGRALGLEEYTARWIDTLNQFLPPSPHSR